MRQHRAIGRAAAAFLFAACVFVPYSVAAAGGEPVGQVSVTFSTADYSLERADGFDRVRLPDYGRIPDFGRPELPARIFAVAVPPGAEVIDVAFEGDAVELPGTYQLAPVALPRVMGEENPAVYARERALYEERVAETFGSDEPFPPAAGEFMRQAGFRKYNLADVRITPFSYKPKSGRLLYRPSIQVHVRYRMPEGAAAARPVGCDLPSFEAEARELVANYEQACAWYEGFSGAAPRNQPHPSLVIITLPTLTSAVQPIVDWEVLKNREVHVVTTTWIASNYTGYDLAEKMRNFLRAMYPADAWAIEDVLLVGDYDDVPMRRTAQDEGYGSPETDFYYAELSLPDSESWDKDGDHKWGEGTDPIDFYNEVNVGRIPWSDAATVTKICNKSVAYEQNQDPSFKKSMLCLGSFFWAKTDNAVLMECKIAQASHPWMSDWNITRMYEQNSTCWSQYPCDYPLIRSNVTSVWPAGKYAFVNWAGHGSPTSCHIMGNGTAAFIQASDYTKMNDSYPAIIFAAACSNADTDYDNIGQMMLKQGAVGFVGSNKVAYGTVKWSGPGSGNVQSMDYFFSTYATEGVRSQGAAHQKALRTMYTNGYFGHLYYDIFEFGSLWGSPSLGMGPVPPIYINLPDGEPGGVTCPGTTFEVTVEVRGGLENPVPAECYLHYRYDGGAFTTAPLTPLGNDLYLAELPATKPGDMPQFYFSAKSSGGTVIYSPADAPASFYSYELFIPQKMMFDDFETDQGWTVVSEDLQSGEWERAAPGFSFSQPGEDHSENGTLCWVTGKEAGMPEDDDVDGGPTRLISPDLDFSCGDGILSFYLFFYHGPFGQFQPLEIDFSNDGGATWTHGLSVLNDHNGWWIPYDLRVSKYVAPTDKVRIRFSICDNPDDDIVEGLLDDFTSTGLWLDPAFWADGYSVPASTGARVEFTLNAGLAHGGRNYLILGSLSGTLPGFPLPGGVKVPLVWDVFTDFLLGCLGTPICEGFQGKLDAQGRAFAALDTFGPVDPMVIGLQANFAFLLGPPPSYDFASNAVLVTFDP